MDLEEFIARKDDIEVQFYLYIQRSGFELGRTNFCRVWLFLQDLIQSPLKSGQISPQTPVNFGSDPYSNIDSDGCRGWDFITVIYIKYAWISF